MKNTTPKSKLVRTLIWIGRILGGLVLVFAIFMAAMMVRMSYVPSDLNYATRRDSDNGLYRVSYTASTGTVPVNQMHQWTLHVETADGQIVEGAAITVDGDMPQHGHGLPTRPQVTQYLGSGDYLVEGMKFQMGGWWLMDFTITANGQTDAVHFNMMLK
ncbi:MAG TPA: FixH family protein [Anaerolineales bacterium]|nr:FixH family protein [Anaerolineales bacterium]